MFNGLCLPESLFLAVLLYHLLIGKIFSSVLTPLPLNVPLAFLKANHMRANYQQETQHIAPSIQYQAIFLSHPQPSS